MVVEISISTLSKPGGLSTKLNYNQTRENMSPIFGKNYQVQLSTHGWSEPAATNAPVEDEPVQPVLRMNILLARRDFFFHLLSAPKFSTSPLLPTTYQPHPPSLHRQSSRDLEWLWSGSWSCGCGAGARVGPAGVGAGPMRPRKGKMLTFFFVFFICFVWRRLEKSSSSSSFFAALQLSCSAAKKKAFFFFAAEEKEEKP